MKSNANNIKNLKICKKLKTSKYKLIKQCAIGAILIPTIIFSPTIVYDRIDKKMTYTKYEKEITEHDNKLKEYASQFDSDNTPSIEIILTVMDYIRSNTIYCQRETNEISYYPRLVLNDENNIGVCRHMADEFTTIMNLIDPRFEAYNLAVRINEENNEIVFCNINTPSLQEDENMENQNYSSDDSVDNNQINSDNNIVNNQPNILNNIIKPVKDFFENIEDISNKALYGDHEITILKPIGENYYLVVDVTNPSIGIIDNGKIYMFNSHNYTLFEYRPFEQFRISVDDTFFGVNKAFALSYFQDLDLVELEKEYGLEEQNKILKKYRNSKKD